VNGQYGHGGIGSEAGGVGGHDEARGHGRAAGAGGAGMRNEGRA
jgi:hypothetical protein